MTAAGACTGRGPDAALHPQGGDPGPPRLDGLRRFEATLSHPNRSRQWSSATCLATIHHLRLNAGDAADALTQEALLAAGS